MMGNSKSIYMMAIWALGVVGVSACSHPESKKSHSHHVLDKVRENQPEVFYYEEISEESLEGIRKVLANVPEAKNEFYVLERTSGLQSFPCSNCHTSPLEELRQKAGGENFQHAHWDIKLHHAGEGIMNCATCHNTANPDELVSLTGKALQFDHSYEQCAQCHSTQYKDWVGGAHGKKASGWVPPRVSLSCTGCHNPHQPAFQPRWPARLNTQKIEERN